MDYNVGSFSTDEYVTPYTKNDILRETNALNQISKYNLLDLVIGKPKTPAIPTEQALRTNTPVESMIDLPYDTTQSPLVVTIDLSEMLSFKFLMFLLLIVLIAYLFAINKKLKKINKHFKTMSYSDLTKVPTVPTV